MFLVRSQRFTSRFAVSWQAGTSFSSSRYVSRACALRRRLPKWSGWSGEPSAPDPHARITTPSSPCHKEPPICGLSSATKAYSKAPPCWIPCQEPPNATASLASPTPRPQLKQGGGGSQRRSHPASPTGLNRCRASPRRLARRARSLRSLG